MRVKQPTTLVDSSLHPRMQIYLRLRSSQSRSRHSALPPLTSQPLPPNSNSIRTLSTTPTLFKKGGKQESKRTATLNAEKTAGLDPFDFSDYEAAVARAHERLRNDLGKIKAGGRDPEAIEKVRVRLGKGEKEKEEGTMVV